MEIVMINHKLEDEELNLVIPHNKIIGLVNDKSNKIFDLISLKKIGKGKILINNEKIVKEDIIIHRKRISRVEDNIDIPRFILTVEDFMNMEFKNNNLSIKNPDKKIRDSLKIVGLNDNYVTRTITSLSNSEKKLILIAKALLSNPDTIILEEPFKYLDLNQEKRLFMLLLKLKEQFNKTIVLKSGDTNSIYNYTTEVIIVKNDNILMQGETKESFHRVDFLKRNGIKIPNCVKFTYLAKKEKDVKIEYHSDIRDIIKDIYKHV